MNQLGVLDLRGDLGGGGARGEPHYDRVLTEPATMGEVTCIPDAAAPNERLPSYLDRMRPRPSGRDDAPSGEGLMDPGPGRTKDRGLRHREVVTATESSCPERRRCWSTAHTDHWLCGQRVRLSARLDA